MAAQNIGEEFMEKTQHQHMGPSLQSQGVPQPPLENPIPNGKPVIDLPPAQPAGSLDIPAIDLRRAIEQRHSVRSYRQEALSLAELSFLLWATQGVKQVTERPVTLRTVTSAGARHAFETYLNVNRVEGLEPGLYRFLAVQHKLVLLDQGPDLTPRLMAACLSQKMIETDAVTFIWVAEVERMFWRYGMRGYRYLHLDAGHVCQNLYLAAEAAHCGVCAIAAYDDDQVNQFLGIDGVKQFAIYLAAVGKV
jgi:SagB-type dehydrogenase family enzyme